MIDGIRVIKILIDKILKVLNGNSDEEEDKEKKDKEEERFKPSSRIREKLRKIQMEDSEQQQAWEEAHEEPMPRQKTKSEELPLSPMRKKLMEISKEEKTKQGANAEQIAEQKEEKQPQQEQAQHEAEEKNPEEKSEKKGIENIISSFKITKEALIKIAMYSRIAYQHKFLGPKDEPEELFGMLISPGNDVVRDVRFYYGTYSKIADKENIEKIITENLSDGEKIMGFFYQNSTEDKNTDYGILLKNMAKEFAVKNSVYKKRELGNSEYSIIIEDKGGKKVLKAVPKSKEDATVFFEMEMPECVEKTLASYFNIDEVKIKKSYSIEKQLEKRGKCHLIRVDKSQGREFDMHTLEFEDTPGKTFSERAVKRIQVIDSDKEVSLDSLSMALLKTDSGIDRDYLSACIEDVALASESRVNAFIEKLKSSEAASAKTTCSETENAAAQKKTSGIYEKIKKIEETEKQKGAKEETKEKTPPEKRTSGLYKKIKKIEQEQNHEPVEQAKKISGIYGKIQEQKPAEQLIKKQSVKSGSSIYENLKESKPEKIVMPERPSAKIERMKKEFQTIDNVAEKVCSEIKEKQEAERREIKEAKPDKRGYPEPETIYVKIDKYFESKKQEFREFADKYLNEHISNYISTLDKKVNEIMEFFDKKIEAFGKLLNNSAYEKKNYENEKKNYEKNSKKTSGKTTGNKTLKAKKKSYEDSEPLEERIKAEAVKTTARKTTAEEIPKNYKKEHQDEAEKIYGNYRTMIRNFYKARENTNKKLEDAVESNNVVAKVAKIVSGDYRANLDEMAHGDIKENYNRKRLWTWDERTEGIKMLYANGIHKNLAEEQRAELLKIAEIMKANTYLKKYRGQQFREIKKLIQDMIDESMVDEPKLDESCPKALEKKIGEEISKKEAAEI